VDNHDTNENAMSITLLLTYGKFRMLDPADLTWNIDRELMCPVNRVGTVDLYSTVSVRGTTGLTKAAAWTIAAPPPKLRV